MIFTELSGGKPSEPSYDELHQTHSKFKLGNKLMRIQLAVLFSFLVGPFRHRKLLQTEQCLFLSSKQYFENW